NPFSEEAGARLYKTGDLARYLPDGNIEFLGRIDHQVKVRGFRIELGEIETALTQYPTIQECVVIAREDEPGNKRLVAYLIAEQPLNVSELRNYLQQRLPEYMIPVAFVKLENLPLSPNGKVDRKALPAPEQSRITLAERFVAPRNSIEQRLVAVWSQVLGIEQIGIEDNFFELGGHSLLATQLVSRIRNDFKVELPLSHLFEAPTVRDLAKSIDSMLRETQGTVVSPILPVSREGILVPSFAQRRLWFLDQLEPNSHVYNIPTAVRLKGRLDHEALERSFNEIISRHESLRTCFTMEAGNPIQSIVPALSLRISLIDLSVLSEEEQEKETQQITTADGQRPFNLQETPLLRVKLLKLAEQERILSITMHHIISDGWSIGVFIRELTSLYEAYSMDRPSPLSPLSIQYADYAAWQHQWLQQEVLEKQLIYWKHKLTNLTVLQLPTDYPRPLLQSNRGAHQSLLLSRELSDGLKTVSFHQGATLFMTTLAAFQVLLYRYSGQEDIAVGSPIANRNRAEIEELIGFFVNTLVMRTDLSGNPSFEVLLERVRETALGAYEHQDIPFEKLVEELQPQRDMSRSPLFQVMFVMQNAPISALKLGELELYPLAIENSAAKFDITLMLEETATGLVGLLEYNTDLFEAATINRMIGHLQILLEGISINPRQRISDLPILSETERHQLLVEWNDTAVDYPHDKCIHQLFEEQVERTPDAIALIYEQEQLTYQQLNQRANQLAHYLRSRAVSAEHLVAICVERCMEMIVGLLGILKAGAAYVPLDPTYPKERLAFMLEDSQTRVLLTQQHLVAYLPEHKAELFCLDSNWPQLAAMQEQNLTNTATSDNLAYIIYTSGSMGRPKGVQIEHKQLCNYVSSICSRLALPHTASFATVSTFAADLGNTMIFSALTCGGCLHVLSQERASNADGLGEYFCRHSIDCL
ncbi:MAG: condensation domain-containing protein, partial [Acidobacteriota bacterium]